ncbi:hypothetical protein KR032_010890 [Drosophila birchii]|nr:hypothetical protein KR032_010890 [Drosophila birchii]
MVRTSMELKTICFLCICFWISIKVQGEDMVHKYYVNSSVCKMRYVDPFMSDVMSQFQRAKLRNCKHDKDIVTSVFDYEKHQYRLHINEDAARPMLETNKNATLECTYQNISRNTTANKPDNKYIAFQSQPIVHNQLVPRHMDFVITKCYAKDYKNSSELLQEDAMTFIPERWTSTERVRAQPSVLIMGLDSISRINLRRSMPSVYEYVSRRPGWFEMQGYNKVGDNTYPNLMPVLTGHSEKGIEKLCNVSKPGCLDTLPFIWKRFKSASYMTAFAEDCAFINTFNYLKAGFIKQPTDYYLRPLLLAIEQKFKVTEDYGFPFCVGRQHSFSYVWNFGKQFVDRFLGRSPIFGFLWSNSFTHDYYQGATALDKLFRKYLRSFEEAHLFERSIVILMSDHGHRYNLLREVASGYFEERMPMMFIYIPPWFRRKYPDLVENLKKNRNRLTSNYDVYMTLQHLLQLNIKSMDDFPDELRAKQCLTCQSLFFEVPFTRTCQMAGIKEKWCCCQPTETIRDPYVHNVALAIVEHMNDHLVKHQLNGLCSNYTLTEIKKVDRKMILDTAVEPGDKDEHVYIVEFSTLPKLPLFEATVRWNNRTKKLLDMDVDDLSRLNSYNDDANCINIKKAKSYCICKDSIKK